jgi:hypothetical protein
MIKLIDIDKTKKVLQNVSVLKLSSNLLFDFEYECCSRTMILFEQDQMSVE